MADAAGAVLDEVGPRAPAGPAARHPVSSEAFLQAASVAWGHLRREERKAVRASCRSGRQQHDRLLCDLYLTLGHLHPHHLGVQPEQSPPSPPELRASLQAALGRGARPQELSLCFKDSHDGRREAQLLAALAACSGCPLSELQLDGAVPLTGATAESVATCCPLLSSLTLDHTAATHLPDAEPTEEQMAEYHLGCVQLLTLCGPRLTELRLLGVQRWQASSYMFLRWCTALTKLELEAEAYNRTPGNDLQKCSIESPGVEACAIGAVAQLTMLRSLRLVTSLGDYWSPEALRPHASCVGRLSSLTALTHLYLDTPVLYEHHADSWHEQQHEGEEHEVWCEVREAHRAALLSALRCMPQLQQLECPTLWLRPSELPVQCTALTSLSLKGLLPPAVEDPQVAADSGAGAQAAVAAMPPQLQELTLRGAASPRALALLRPPSCLVRLDLNTLTFSVTDVTAEGRLHAASADAVGPAVRLLLSYRGGRRCYCNHMDIEYDGGPGRMQPREGAADSHMGWIRELNGLDVCRRLALGGVALSFGDLHCLGRTLGQLRSLCLQDCSFSLAALPAIRPHMLQLTRLEMDLRHCQDVNDGVVESVALQMCCPLPGAAQLRHFQCNSCPMTVDAEECAESVRAQLRDDFGITGVFVCMEHG